MAKVLVIEDNQAVRSVAVRVLRAAGHETVEAMGGHFGVELFRTHKPDLVVTDLFMPEQDGVETIRQIREIDAHIPIIAMSSVQSWGDATPLENARSVGADRVLEKPFAIEELTALVDELLGNPPRG